MPSFSSSDKNVAFRIAPISNPYVAGGAYGKSYKPRMISTYNGPAHKRETVRKHFTYRPINNLPNRHTHPQQPPNLPRKHRPRNIPKQPRRINRSTPSLHIHRLRCKEPIDNRRKRPSSVRNDPFQRCEIDQSLCYSEVHEGARCFEVEFDDAFGVERWVCAGEG
jgi:hypothetical protein